MPIYGINILGRRKRILVRADSQAAARDLFVQAASLTLAEQGEALEAGEAVWKPGTDLPDDEPAPEAEGDDLADEPTTEQ